jgi:hypothetical protein
MIHQSKIHLFFDNPGFFFVVSYRNNHQSPSPPKFNISIQKPLNIESEGEIDDDEVEHQLNIDDSREQNTTTFENDEQSSDDEQVRIYSKEGARYREFHPAKKMKNSLSDNDRSILMKCLSIKR